MDYICSICKQRHEDWPALAFSSPKNYYDLTDEEKSSIAELTSDFCVINYSDQTDRFIRAVLFQKVNGHSEPLHYGIWVSLSERSFKDYHDHFHDDQHHATYFGYLCNDILGYTTTMSIETNVELSIGGNRPEVIPHVHQINHPFVKDYYEGITLEEAHRRIHEMLDITGA